ncbi:MAG: protein kinase [Nocardiopsaceae bacterium]|nr:protein kinase [Nocardiopsaceae bacterium]
MEPLSPRDPRAVGEFQLRARLGSGGMGRVYLGYSPAGRAVAVKVVRPELTDDPEFGRRFAREVDAARAVGGMYTAPVVAAGLNDDPPWLATAFVPGPSLASLVEQHGPLPELAVWRLAAGLTEALRAVHACGVVHRDLKPGNVLLAPDGPHLIDFGISRALDGNSLTQTGMTVGTPGYMAPEQAEGNAMQASDVFSLGALLAFAATGNPPFGRGSAATILYRLVNGEPSLDGLPPELREVVAACMRKDPGSRPEPAALAAMLAQHGASLSADFASRGSATGTFWPTNVADLIRASQQDLPQPGPGQADGRANPALQAPGYPAPTGYPPPTGNTGITGNTGPPGYPGPTGNTAPPVPGYAQHPSGTPTGSTPGQVAQYGPPSSTASPPYGSPSSAASHGGYSPSSPYRTSTPARPRVPNKNAAVLMVIGAVVTLIDLIVALTSSEAIKAAVMAQDPTQSVSAANSTTQGIIVITVTSDVIGILLWLLLAWAASRGYRWPRVTGTVLFVVYTLVLITPIVLPGPVLGKLLDGAVWAVGMATVMALWFFRPARPNQPSGPAY